MRGRRAAIDAGVGVAGGGAAGGGGVSGIGSGKRAGAGTHNSKGRPLSGGPPGPLPIAAAADTRRAARVSAPTDSARAASLATAPRSGQLALRRGSAAPPSAPPSRRRCSGRWRVVRVVSSLEAMRYSAACARTCARTRTRSPAVALAQANPPDHKQASAGACERAAARIVACQRVCAAAHEPARVSAHPGARAQRARARASPSGPNSTGVSVDCMGGGGRARLLPTECR